MSRRNVLIVGASVAGPMSAYWFAKAGWNVTVIERYPRLRPGGQAIDIRLCGVTVMRRIPGMEEAVRSNRAPMSAMTMVGPSGKPVATMHPTGDPNQQALISEYEIFRGDLCKILYDLSDSQPRVKYIFDEQVTAMKHSPSGPITVDFLNKTPTDTFDLVVAADGATSRTRAIGLNAGVRDHVKPLNAWAAYYTIPRDLLAGSKAGHGYSAPGGRFMAIGPDRHGNTTANVMGVRPGAKDDFTSSFRDAQKTSTEATKAHVASWIEGAGWMSGELIKGLSETEDFYSSELVQVKVPTLFKGRFVMVGDAGYAAGPTGTGTSLAIGGAYILAGEMARAKGDIEAGLKAYEERMAPIIKDLQPIPPGVFTFMAPQTAWGIWVRNNFFRVVCLGMKLGWLFNWALGWFAAGFGGDKYNIPEYEF